LIISLSYIGPLYHAYLGPSLKLYSFYLHSLCLGLPEHFSSLSSILICSFWHLYIFITLSNILFFLWFLVIFCHIFIYITVETLWPSIFVEIIFDLPNIYRYISFSVCCFSSCLVILSFFCRFISLTNWSNCYLLFFEHLRCCHQWIS